MSQAVLSYESPRWDSWSSESSSGYGVDVRGSRVASEGHGEREGDWRFFSSRPSMLRTGSAVLPGRHDVGRKRAELKKKIGDLLSWKDDWNGYGAPRIPKYVVYDVQEFLNILPLSIPNPRFAPSSDNEVVLEWRYENSVAVLSFFGDKKLHCFARHGVRKWYLDDVSLVFLQSDGDLFKVLSEVSAGA